MGYLISNKGPAGSLPAVALIWYQIRPAISDEDELRIDLDKRVNAAVASANPKTKDVLGLVRDILAAMNGSGLLYKTTLVDNLAEDATGWIGETDATRAAAQVDPQVADAIATFQPESIEVETTTVDGIDTDLTSTQEGPE